MNSNSCLSLSRISYVPSVESISTTIRFFIFGYLNIRNSSLYYNLDNYPKMKRIYKLDSEKSFMETSHTR